MAYPWVNPKTISTSGVSGTTPTLIFGSDLGCAIDCMFVVNKTPNELLVDVSILREVDDVGISYMIANKIPITGYGKQEIINTNFQNNVGISTTPAVYYTGPGDTLFSNSDFVNNSFDCHVVYREMTEIISMEQFEKYKQKIIDSGHPELMSNLKRSILRRHK